jgi:DNA-directed RNA polymerases I, II, and III subunit RPABC5
MLIPIKCFSCGKVLADLYGAYLRMVREKKIKNDMDVNSVVYLTKNNTEKTIEGEVLDNLQLNKMCCRRHMLTHVDIE